MRGGFSARYRSLQKNRDKTAPWDDLNQTALRHLLKQANSARGLQPPKPI